MNQLIDLQQDIDEQYALFLRSTLKGSYLKLLDRSLLIDICQQYQLGMRAAKLMFTKTVDERITYVLESACKTWVGSPCWVPRDCQYVSDDIRAGITRAMKYDVCKSCTSATWTLHRYRAVAVQFARNTYLKIYWFDANENRVAKQKIVSGIFTNSGMSVGKFHGRVDIYNLYFPRMGR